MSLRKIVGATALLLGFFGTAQNKQLLYDFMEVPQSLMVNPGVKTDFKWYVGVPALSGFSFQAGSSGVSVNDLFANDGVDFNTKVRDKLINGMKVTDELSGTFQEEILNIGFRGSDNSLFYSGGMYIEGDAIGYWPRDYVVLTFDGNADRLNREFDLSHLKFRGEILNVLHFGINKRYSDKLTVGARAKLYSGIIDFHSTRNKGYLVTTEGQNNIYANTIDADLMLRTSGINGQFEDNTDGVNSNLLIKRALFGGDLGLGFDLGFSYNLDEQTVFTASLLDIGFITHSNDVKTYTLKGKATVEGMEIIYPAALGDPNKDYWQELVDEVETLVPFEDNNKGYITFRPTRLNASIRRDFGEQVDSKADCGCGPNVDSQGMRKKYVNSVGGQLYAVMRPRGPQMALTAFYQRRFGNILALKTTYTVDKFTYSNIGLGMNLQAGPVNFYVMADDLLSYRNLAASRYLSLQFGLNIVSWGRN